MLGLEDVKRLLAIAGFEDVVTPLANRVRRQRAHEGVVVSDEGFHATMTTMRRPGIARLA
jgi:hypothetical protein